MAARSKGHDVNDSISKYGVQLNYVHCNICNRTLVRVSDCIAEVICPECKTELVIKVENQNVTVSPAKI